MILVLIGAILGITVDPVFFWIFLLIAIFKLGISMGGPGTQTGPPFTWQDFKKKLAERRR